MNKITDTSDTTSGCPTLAGNDQGYIGRKGMVRSDREVCESMRASEWHCTVCMHGGSAVNIITSVCV